MADRTGNGEGSAGSSTALRLIAGLLVIGALYLLRPIVVPFVLALVLAIALEPVVDRLVKRGIPNTVASLLAMLMVAAALIGIGGLVVSQAAGVLGESEKYVSGFTKVLAKAARATGSTGTLTALGMDLDAGEDPGMAGGPAAGREADVGNGRGEDGTKAMSGLHEALRRNASTLGEMAARGVGGLLGVVANLLLLLAFLFYMLQSRGEWLDRTTEAMRQVGMRPRREALEMIQTQLVAYLGRLGLVSMVYVVVITLALWLIGVPRPLLWGLLTGVLEVVPYVGPLLAAALPAIVSLSSGEVWQPLAVVGLFALLQTVEGYVVAPLLYGGAVEINPVTVLFGVLFFGWLLGPWGLALAMPCMIMLRGLLVLAPDTPALDAMLEADRQETLISS